jgi:hypothetical protein
MSLHPTNHHPGGFQLGGYQSIVDTTKTTWNVPNFTQCLPLIITNPRVKAYLVRSNYWQYFLFDPYTGTFYHPEYIRKLVLGQLKPSDTDENVSDESRYSQEHMRIEIQKMGYRCDGVITRKQIIQILNEMISKKLLGAIVADRDGKQSWHALVGYNGSSYVDVAQPTFAEVDDTRYVTEMITRQMEMNDEEPTSVKKSNPSPSTTYSNTSSSCIIS